MRSLQKISFIAAALCVGTSNIFAAVIFTNLIAFNGTNGANPQCNLVPGPNGNFYGTTANGGTNGFGTVFEISPDGSFFTNLYNFAGGTNGAGPAAALTLGSDGYFYGTTYNGGISNWGTVFRISTSGDFASLGMLGGTNGANPDVALLQAPDGSFYGGTRYGGPFNTTTSGGTGYGTVFRITTNGIITTPILFAGTNGANPTALVLGTDGNFYGVTTWGGYSSPVKFGLGTIYRLGADGSLSNLYKFTGFGDGGFPQAGLVQGKDGNFYGTTQSGGSVSIGTVFRMTPDGQFTSLVSFPNSNAGGYPYAALIQTGDGHLYGTTYIGGTNNVGSIFEVTPTGSLTSWISFTGTGGGWPGSHPLGSLVQGTDGNFYGTTYDGGANGKGTVFRLSLPVAPVFLSIAKSAGTVTLVWSSVASQTYQLEYTTNLAQPGWNNVGGGVVATNGTLSATDSVGTDPDRFYRVVLSDIVSQ